MAELKVTSESPNPRAQCPFIAQWGSLWVTLRRCAFSVILVSTVPKAGGCVCHALLLLFLRVKSGHTRLAHEAVSGSPPWQTLWFPVNE